MSMYLEANSKNPLTLFSMPILDLGEKPKTFSVKKPESDQVYLVAKSSYPDKVVIKYADCKPCFNIQNLKRKY